MFKRENRLISGIRFDSSCFLANPQFILKKKKNKLNINRFGIVVSKKIDKRAVVRNRIKRIFRETLVDLNKIMTSGNDILLITKKDALGKTRKEIAALLEKVLEKAGVVKK